MKYKSGYMSLHLTQALQPACQVYLCLECDVTEEFLQSELQCAEQVQQY